MPEEKTINQIIQEWLTEQGYPLEMLVAQAFKKAGARVRQSEYYIDSESQQPRELDLTAEWYSSAEDYDLNFANTVLSFVIECKSQQSKPWIIFSDQVKEDHPFCEPPMTRDGEKLINELNRPTDILGLRKKVGYGITQALTNGADIPYKAIMSTTKASFANIAYIEELYNDTKDLMPAGSLDLNPFISIPVVITDGLLFECYLDDHNESVLTPIEYGAVEWKYPMRKNSSISTTLVLIYTYPALEKLVTQAIDLATCISDTLPEWFKTQVNKHTKKD